MQVVQQQPSALPRRVILGLVSTLLVVGTMAVFFYSADAKEGTVSHAAHTELATFSTQTTELNSIPSSGPHSQSYNWTHHIADCDLNHDPDCQSAKGTTSSIVYQREDKALRDFLAATGGPNNANTKCNGCSWMPYTKGNLWGGTNNHCEWYGVECVGSNHYGLDPFAVQRLMLGQTNLTGTIPESIGDFYYTLNQLNLRGGWPDHEDGMEHNIMSGTVPTSIGKLTHVDSLILSDQAFTGAIPASMGDMAFSYAGITQFDEPRDQEQQYAFITTPTMLTLNNNQFTGPLPASLCVHNIDYFDVSDNHLTGTVPAACFNEPVQESNRLMFSNNFTGPVPACRGDSCPAELKLH